jgi:hypothetical protein
MVEPQSEKQNNLDAGQPNLDAGQTQPNLDADPTPEQQTIAFKEKDRQEKDPLALNNNDDSFIFRQNGLEKAMSDFFSRLINSNADAINWLETKTAYSNFIHEEITDEDVVRTTKKTILQFLNMISNMLTSNENKQEKREMIFNQLLEVAVRDPKLMKELSIANIEKLMGEKLGTRTELMRNTKKDLDYGVNLQKKTPPPQTAGGRNNWFTSRDMLHNKL